MQEIQLEDVCLLWYNDHKELIVQDCPDNDEFINLISGYYGDSVSHEIVREELIFTFHAGDIDIDELEEILAIRSMSFVHKKNTVRAILASCTPTQKKDIHDHITRSSPSNVGDAEDSERDDIREDGADSSASAGESSTSDSTESEPTADDRPF